MTQQPISLEALNTKITALFNALQIVCTGLSEEQQKSIAEVLEQTADLQFSTPIHAHVSDEAKQQGAAISRRLSETILKSLKSRSS